MSALQTSIGVLLPEFIMALGGMAMGFCLLVIALRVSWPVELAKRLTAPAGL